MNNFLSNHAIKSRLVSFDAELNFTSESENKSLKKSKGKAVKKCNGRGRGGEVNIYFLIVSKGFLSVLKSLCYVNLYGDHEFRGPDPVRPFPPTQKSKKHRFSEIPPPSLLRSS